MTQRIEGLTLYHFESCPFCKRVRRGLADLGVEVQLQDIEREIAHLQRNAMLQQQQRRQVSGGVQARATNRS